MIALAKILSGSGGADEWFSEQDVKSARGFVFHPDGFTDSHARFTDKVSDPTRCSVERTFLNFAGVVQETKVIELRCDEFWAMIRDVDNFYERWRYLPSSAGELELYGGA
jgi:hypothetical protein